MDWLQIGMTLGRVLEVSERTARKVDLIERRQAGLISRIDKLESRKSPRSSPRQLIAALSAAALAAFANLEADQIASLIRGLTRGLGSH